MKVVAPSTFSAIFSILIGDVSEGFGSDLLSKILLEFSFIETFEDNESNPSSFLLFSFIFGGNLLSKEVFSIFIHLRVYIQ